MHQLVVLHREAPDILQRRCGAWLHTTPLSWHGQVWEHRFISPSPTFTKKGLEHRMVPKPRKSFNDMLIYMSMYSHISSHFYTFLTLWKSTSARRKGPLCNIFRRGHCEVSEVLSSVLQILFAQLTSKKHQVEWATPRFTSLLAMCTPKKDRKIICHCFARTSLFITFLSFVGVARVAI